MSIDVLSVVLGFVAGLAVLGAFVAYRSRSHPGHGTSSETLGTPPAGSPDDVANGAYFAELARTVPDMVVVIGPDRVRRYISPACEWLLGYPPEEMIGQSPINGIHPDDRATTMEASERLFKGEVSVALTTYRHRHADGHYVWLEAHFATRWNEDGELRDYIGVVRDIGGRRREKLLDTERNARIRENNRLLQMAEQIANVGHWRVDVQEDTLIWSDQVYRIHGVDSDFTPTVADGLEFYYEEAYGRHHKEPNKPFVYHVALGVFVFLCALGLTTIRPIHALIVLGMLAFGIWSLVFVLEGQIKAHANVVRHRPSFWKLIRSPSIAGAKVLWRFLCELKIGIGEILLGGFCFSFVSLICLGLMLGALGPSALIFFAVLGVSVVAILGLRTRRTSQGAEVLAAIEHYAHGFDAAKAGDETGGWADALALGYLDSVGGADEVNDAKEIQALSAQVPTWFSKSGGDAQAFELAQVLADRVPRAFNDAMTIYK